MIRKLHRALLHVSAVAMAVLFSTACGTAPAPHTAATYTVATESTTRPTTALDVSGERTYVAWVAKDDSVSNVYLARLDQPNDTTFSQPVRVNDKPGDAAGHQQAPAQVAVGPDGTVYIAWITQTIVPGRRFPASDIRLARSTDGGQTFEAAVTVNEDSGFPTGHHFHNLAVGPDGTVYVSWLDSRERDRAQISQPARVASNHSHKSDHGAHAHTTAHDAHSGHGMRAPARSDELPGTQLRVARSTDGGRSFGPSVVVAEGTCQCCRTALATGTEGTVYVAWRHIFGGMTRDMAIARSDDGGQTFTRPVRIHADGWAIDGCPHSGPSIAIDRDENIHVAWYTGAPDKAGLYYTVSHDGGKSFEPAQTLIRDVPVAQVSVTAGEDETWIAWEDPLKDCICLTRVDENGMLRHETTTLPGASPSFTDSEHTRALVWREGDAIRLQMMQKGS